MKGYLGDAVLAAPLLQALSLNELTIRAPEIVHTILKSPSWSYQALHAEPFRGVASLFREAQKLRAHPFNAAILINRSFPSALLAKIARIPVRIGHATEGRSRLLTNPVPYDEMA